MNLSARSVVDLTIIWNSIFRNMVGISGYIINKHLFIFMAFCDWRHFATWNTGSQLYLRWKYLGDNNDLQRVTWSKSMPPWCQMSALIRMWLSCDGTEQYRIQKYTWTSLHIAWILLDYFNMVFWLWSKNTTYSVVVSWFTISETCQKLILTSFLQYVPERCSLFTSNGFIVFLWFCSGQS